MTSSELLKRLAEGKLSANDEVVLDERDTIYDLGGATVTVGIRITAEGVTLKNGRVAVSGGTGISIEGADGVVFGITVTGAETGIAVKASDAVVKQCDIADCTFGIRAELERSEISAAMSGGYNILAEKNRVSADKTALVFKNVSNGVAVLNELSSASVRGCTNVYVIENNVEGALELCDNNYIIANGNSARALLDNNNLNKNGDNITDISARAEMGANEELLPHTNTEQFVGMARKRGVRCENGVMPIFDYITANIGKGVVVVPPGAYYGVGMVFEKIEAMTLYCYGMLYEMDDVRAVATRWRDCGDITFKGIFFGNRVYPCTQGTVVSVDGDTLSFVTDPGYKNNFSDGRHFGGGAPCFGYKHGLMSPECDFRYGGKSYDPVTGLNTLVKTVKWLNVGDRLICRTDFSEGVLHVKCCHRMITEDITVYSCWGFAESDSDCDNAPVLHRYAVTKGPAPVLDENGDYKGFEALIHRDGYGRLRSTEPMSTTCDATHCTNSRHGLQLVSSLLERMNDDGGNINAHYGLAVSFDKATKTLEYSRCNVNTYRLLPNPFKAGDEAMLYSMNGTLVAKTVVLSDVEVRGEDSYLIKVADDIELPEGEPIVVQNISATGNGFLLDNVVVRDEGCNAIRIKAMGGEIRNCNFERISKGAIDCVPEYQHWPECGYANNIRITKNIFRDLGRCARLSEVSEECAWCASICIRYTLWDKEGSSNATSDPARCLNKNIEIYDNVFTSRYPRYEICMSSMDNVKVVNNTFGGMNPEVTNEDDKRTVLLVFGGRNIEYDGNRFEDGAGKRIEYRYGKDAVANVHGSDVPPEFVV